MGADTKAYNNFAVRWASECGHLKVVKYLVSVGADIYIFILNIFSFPILLKLWKMAIPLKILICMIRLVKN